MATELSANSLIKARDADKPTYAELLAALEALAEALALQMAVRDGVQGQAVLAHARDLIRRVKEQGVEG